MTNKTQSASFEGRLKFIKYQLIILVGIIVFRVGSLHITERDFLQSEGDKRTVRYETIPAHRGIIFDRNGKPLAISTKVVSLWVNPKEFLAVDDADNTSRLAKLLNLNANKLAKKLKQNSNKEFLYIKRRLQPSEAEKILDFNISGLYGIDEYQRFYPSGEVASHLVGFTNIDDQGQEGLELAFDQWLSGESGVRRTLKNRRGDLIKETEIIKGAKLGRELTLSIDLRMQYLAYKELKKSVKQYSAKAASLVMLDVHTGEILAMVNQPSFNPNNRDNLVPKNIRNRAVTDTFEPGSIMKPFSIAAALQSGKYNPNTLIDTYPGYMRIGKNMVKDTRNFGELTVTQIITKSSNVGVSKIMLSLGTDRMINMLQKLGFGRQTGIIFPGEANGVLPARLHWSFIDTATLSFGYGISVTALQIAQAYMILANGGVMHQITLLKQDPAAVSEGMKVIDEKITKSVVDMMKTVVSSNGTGRRARVSGYQVAGKTGTAKKASADGYSSKYMGSFAGIAPVDDPRIAMVVVVDSPGSGYYGGVVAAPVFSKVVEGSLRLLGVRPDSEESSSLLADIGDFKLQ